MSFTVIIPARFGSSRLPGKPLKDLVGKSMIQRVYDCASQSEARQVIVATDDQRIADVVQQFGGQVCLTSENHESGTDRLQEVVTALALDDAEIVVNVQGDEPLIPASVINQVADNLLRSPRASVATLCEPITDIELVFDANIVKVVTDNNEMALYFSRAPIPWSRDHYLPFNAEKTTEAFHQLPRELMPQRHIGIYAYRVGLLHQFVTWPPASLELCERLEQLRILANGHGIHVARAVTPVPGGVDTELDLKRVRQLLAPRAGDPNAQ